MRIKNPGGELAWLTPLLAIGGIYLGYTSWMEGSHVVAVVFASIGLLSLLVWFDHKWVATPLIAIFSITFVLGCFMLFQRAFSLRRLVHLLALAFAIYELWVWQHRPGDDDSENELDEVLLKHNPSTIYSSADDADLRR